MERNYDELKIMKNVHSSKAQKFAPYILLTVVLGVFYAPIFLALQRLIFVSNWSISSMFDFFQENTFLQSSMKFSLIQAFFSATLAMLIGTTIAWHLGRYTWRNKSILDSFFSLPFITPSIVAAAGFLALSSQHGILMHVGIDIQSSDSFLNTLGNSIGIENFGRISLLIFAHAWFNVSLFIRFLEPRISSLHPHFEMQFHLLPNGSNTWYRWRTFWMPYLGGSIISAWLFSFFFSFTSFALIRWLVPGEYTLESLAGTFGQFAGIQGYRIDATRIVLISTLVQFMMLCIVFWFFQKQRNRMNHSYEAILEREHVRIVPQPSTSSKFLVWGLGLLAITPYLSILLSSFQIREQSTTSEFRWSLDAWRQAFSNDFQGISVLDALLNSFLYAIIAICIVVPLSILVSIALLQIEKQGKKRIADGLEFLCIAPLFLSAVTVGLGLSIGLMSLPGNLLQWRWLPVLPHVFLTFPFALRILQPAMKRVDEKYMMQAKLLNRSALSTIWLGMGVHLKNTVVVVIALSFAFSFGEFGASFLIVRFESWTSLSILVDVLLSRPKFDPIAYPLAMVVATILLFFTFFSLLIINTFQHMEGEHHD
jgi:thiamine transport system permease protein